MTCTSYKIAELLKRVKINELPFICEILCGYQKSDSHDKNDEISNPLNLSGTICKEQVQKTSDRQILANLQTFYPEVFAGHCL